MSDEIKVGMEEFKKVDYPDILNSGGFGPCVIIGILNKSNRKGYMFHYPNIEFHEENIIKYCKEIVSEIKSNDEMQIQVAGGCILEYDSIEEKEGVEESRFFTEDLLETYFKNYKYQISWNNVIPESSLTVDTESNSIYFE